MAPDHNKLTKNRQGDIFRFGFSKHVTCLVWFVQYLGCFVGDKGLQVHCEIFDFSFVKLTWRHLSSRLKGFLRLLIERLEMFYLHNENKAEACYGMVQTAMNAP